MHLRPARCEGAGVPGGGASVTIARLQAFRRILLTLLRMVEEELCERGALRESVDLRRLTIGGIVRPDE